MADRWTTARHLLDIHAGYRLMHNHWLDPAYGGQYYMRLPDGTRVPIGKYEARLETQRAAEREARLRRMAARSQGEG